MYSIGVYDWSQIATPPELSANNLRYDGGANDPGQSNYNPGLPTWTDKTYTFTGGTPTKIKVIDDDGDFEDGYVETGAPATLAEDVTINGVTYTAGSVVENEFSLADGSGTEVWVLRINGENVGFVPQSLYTSIPAGSTFTPTEGRGGTIAESSDGVISSEPYAGVICFTPQTRIDTPNGPVPAGRLRPGDLLLTADHGAQPVRWIARTRVTFDTPDDPARPVLIPRDAFGPGLPARQMQLSPQHRILLTGPVTGQGQGVLAPARGLMPFPGVRVMRGVAATTYVHVFLDRHEILSAEGVPAESFYPGRMALRALAPADRRRLDPLIPVTGYGPPARQLITRSDAANLAASQRSATPDAPDLMVPAFDSVMRQMA